MVCFGWGAKVYLDLRHMPKDAMEIHVVAKKWLWEFVYKNGVKVTTFRAGISCCQSTTKVGVDYGRKVE